MSPAWADNLDMLALNGVLDFDAPSYVTGQNPRYVGSIGYTPSPFGGPKPQTKNLQQPEIDEFKYGFAISSVSLLIFIFYNYKKYFFRK